MLCCRFRFFIPQGFNRCVELDNHARKALCECIVNIARHPRAFFQNQRMPLLLSELGSMDCQHHVMGQRLGKFNLLAAIRALVGVLNAYESAEVSRHEHRNRHESLTSSCRYVFAKLWTDTCVALNVVDHQRKRGEEHLMKESTQFLPGVRVLNEGMIEMRWDLLTVFNDDVQAE